MRRSSSALDEEIEERTKRHDRWMATKQWENRGRASTDQRDHIKTVEIDTSRPFSYSNPSARRSQHQQQQSHYNHYNHQQQQQPSSHSLPSPSHRALNTYHSFNHIPVTPSPSKTRPLQVRSASPRFSRDERNYPTTQTPRATYFYNNSTPHGGGGIAPIPNYMVATESAKARVRSQSAPRQRPSTPERDRTGYVKKRLSYPVADPYGLGQDLKSPSFKSVQGGGYFRTEQLSCYTESSVGGGEISPSSTTDLRRWLSSVVSAISVVDLKYGSVSMPEPRILTTHHGFEDQNQRNVEEFICIYVLKTSLGGDDKYKSPMNRNSNKGTGITDVPLKLLQTQA
ncbi:hypothetical protein GIB67_041252 [Kingdonia uniflora]|uniref:DUF4005 domain-containing protein n=1 Tax=Kingdonia uniflora TaxID=39325 RepID=A0A7J7LMH2_9MAGN|nr:hypothetical protein GIB67_041252 [Kingdonia uniflora]